MKPNDLLLEVGNNIMLARKARNLTQQELADRASISRQAVAAIEKGRLSKNLLMVIWALGLEKQLVEAISSKNDDIGRSMAFGSLPKRVSKSKDKNIDKSMEDEF